MKKLQKNLAFFAGLFLCVACSSNEEFKFEDIEIPTIDQIEFAASEKTANDALNDFGFKLLNTAVNHQYLFESDDDNISISPLSASIALGLLANTGDSDMEQSICTMLDLEDLSALNATCNKLMRYLPRQVDGTELILANSAWYNENINITPLDSWCQNLKTNYYATVMGLDFSNRKSLSTINGWCSDKTKGLIPTALESLDDKAALYLINTLFFSSNWRNQFSDEETTDGKFMGTKEEKTVRMMHTDRVMSYGEGADYSFITMAFEGDSKMYLILPEGSKTAMDLAAELSEKLLVNKSSSKKVQLSLPKFKVETSADITPVLAQLGLNLSSEFEKMGVSGQRSIVINQKTNTEIDENGGKLAAVTVIKDLTSAGNQDYDKVTMSFDKPFIYLIKNETTGSILMAGVVNNIY